MSVAFRVCAAVSALLSTSVSGLAYSDAKAAIPTQYVIISFDGAHDMAQWKRSRALAQKTGASFTYFLSCVFLLSPETRGTYKAPGKGAGKSNVGFAESTGDVAGRLNEIWTARAEGHEIASHACGHFDGKNWSKADWLKEFEGFSSILREAWAVNGIDGEPDGWRHFAESEIIGFRAPYLSTNDSLFPALAARGFSYDASGVSKGPAAPDRRDSVRRFALPQIPEGPSERRVIAMDYNLFVRHSGGFEKTDEDAVFENRTYDAFLASFEKEYAGKRTPLQIGFHFTLMNGGAYWRALERFAEEVCVRPGVACVSYRDYLRQVSPDTPQSAKPASGVGG